MELSDLKNRDIDVCLVSSGAMAIGRQLLGESHKSKQLPINQMHASVGQARLMGIYQKYLMEYNQICGQVLMTKNTMLNDLSRKNAQNAFLALLDRGVIPIVNNNDTVSTYEIEFGDNDTLSAIVTALIGADLLIILTDTEGLYSSDPKSNPDAALIPVVKRIDDDIIALASDRPGSDFGTGGMRTKVSAAAIATASGADVIIASGDDVSILHKIFENDYTGTLFESNYDDNFDLLNAIERMD